MKLLRYILICLSLALPAGAYAAEPLLVYFENNSGGLRLALPDGSIARGNALQLGMSLAAGTTILTDNGDFAELELANGSIIKVQENTNFKITTLQGEKGATENSFEMTVGKFRAVAAKGGDQRYTFKTRSAVCGIRGTDTGAESLIDPGTKNFLPSKVFVFQGQVDVTKLDELGNALKQITLAAGQWVDTGAADFAAAVMGPALIEGFKKGLDFIKLDPGKVPGFTAAALDDGAATAETDEAGQKETEPDWVKALREIIGLEIGAVTLGDETYAKAVLAPQFKLDKFKLSLYLPVIYRVNLFDPNDWYKPEGNNEWSFGTDASFGDNWWLRVGDFAYDLVLKIKGLEYGGLRDDFYLKLGNLHSFTVGHGMLMRNYANDTDFPALRRVGFQMGVDTGPFGFELVSNDLGMVFKAQPEIAGTRLYFRPFHPFALAFGLSLIADLDPAKDLPSLGDPMFFNLGLDLDFPIVETEGFNLVLFSDFAFMLPYFRNDVPGAPVIPAGFAFDAIIHGPPDSKAFKNFGAAAGLLGNVAIFEWRLEGRYYTGKFKPAFFNAIYDRVKTDYVNEVIDYLRNPGSAAAQTTVFGVYGEGVLHIEKLFSVTLGYLCPLAFTPTGLAYGEEDFFQIKFSLEPKVIPVVGIFGSISYERSKFVSSFARGLPALFDENTVVKTAIGYPVAEGLSIIFYYTTTRRLDPVTGIPGLVHAFTFETVIDF